MWRTKVCTLTVICIAVSLFTQLLLSVVFAAEVKVAVASNFASTARALVEQYSKLSDDDIVLLVGSTGKHTSQIQYGLPADVFLAADSARPKLLEDLGLTVPGSRHTYAIGRLVLWSKDSSLVDPQGQVLGSSIFKRLAIANPKTAPYGAAANQVLLNLGFQPSLVYGESVAQAFQFANSGAAELAMLALSQVKNLQQGSFWLVPSDLHLPIEQQLVLLNNLKPARDFVDFLATEQGLSIIQSHGYARPELVRSLTK
ncbi:MAG: molybdate transport system substrate-binding protein [Arenicella sp.]|jgi:molybdate transport system substrate-binding protein